MGIWCNQASKQRGGASAKPLMTIKEGAETAVTKGGTLPGVGGNPQRTQEKERNERKRVHRHYLRLQPHITHAAGGRADNAGGPTNACLLFVTSFFVAAGAFAAAHFYAHTRLALTQTHTHKHACMAKRAMAGRLAPPSFPLLPLPQSRTTMQTGTRTHAPPALHPPLATTTPNLFSPTRVLSRCSCLHAR